MLGLRSPAADDTARDGRRSNDDLARIEGCAVRKRHADATLILERTITGYITLIILCLVLDCVFSLWAHVFVMNGVDNTVYFDCYAALPLY